MKVFSCRFFTACLLLATQTAGANTIGEHDDAHVPRRLSVSPEQSIATEIETAHAMGIAKPRLTLHADTLKMSNTTSTTNIFASSATTQKDVFEVHVREAEPAITSMTTTSVQGGVSRSVNVNQVVTMLVSDDPGVFALISVEQTGRTVNGIVKKSGLKDIQFTQDGQGGKVSSMFICFLSILGNCINTDFVQLYQL